MTIFEVEVTHYDYDKHETVVDGKVNLPYLAKSLTPEAMAELLSNWANCYQSPIKRGEAMGKVIAEQHRSLQGLVINTLVSTIASYAKAQDGWTDPRNEAAVRLAKSITHVAETVGYQPLI